MDRLIQRNVMATSGRAVEAAGDVDVLLLDKTGTITLGQSHGDGSSCLRRGSPERLADAAQLASLADETPEGRCIVVLAKEKFGIRGREVAEAARAIRAVHRANPDERRGFPALDGQPARRIRKGAAMRIRAVTSTDAGRRSFRKSVTQAVERISRSGGTPLVVARRQRSAGRRATQGCGERRHQGTLCATCARWGSRR